MPSPVRAIIGSLLLAALACRPGDGGLRLDPHQAEQLRADYGALAAQLPALRFDQVELPAAGQVASFSPLRWELRVPALPAEETLRALPYPDLGPRLRELFASHLGEVGLAIGATEGRPALQLAIEVHRLVLRSEAPPADRRRCELELVVRIAEAPTALELCRYRVQGRSELPGSWLALREGHAQWAPRPGDADPLAEAVALAAQAFLQQSLPFWRDPANWEEGNINLTWRHPAWPRSPRAAR
jgi:hypothetical protein